MGEDIVCAKEEDIVPGKILWYVHQEWAYGIESPENFLVIITKIAVLSKLFYAAWDGGIAGQFFKTDCVGDQLFSLHTPDKPGIVSDKIYEYMLRLQECNGIFTTKDMTERYIQSVDKWKHLVKFDKPISDNEVNVSWYQVQKENKDE